MQADNAIHPFLYKLQSNYLNQGLILILLVAIDITY